MTNEHVERSLAYAYGKSNGHLTPKGPAVTIIRLKSNNISKTAGDAI